MNLYIGNPVQQPPASHLFHQHCQSQESQAQVLYEQLSSLNTKLQEALEEKDSESKEMIELNRVQNMSKSAQSLDL